MILVSYDIAEDKLRTRFSKYLTKFGHRIQYSVFEIDNSEKIINNICAEVDNHFKKRFSEADSVYIFVMAERDKIIRYGYAKNEEADLIVIG